jgi:uncharacterized membrane protein
MNRKRPKFVPYLMLAFAFIGIANASYDSYTLHSGQSLWCPPPIDGCNTVAGSVYAHIFGLPLGYFSLIFYLHMFALAALLVLNPFSRGLRLGAFLYAALGVCFSICSICIQFTIIQAFCIYCLLSAVLTLVLLIAALSHFRSSHRPVVKD